MTAWRTPIVRRAENTQHSGKDHSTGRQPENATAIRADPPQPRRSVAGTITKLFREVKKAVTQARAPQLARRKRKDTEETRRGFRPAAVHMTRLVRFILHRNGERFWLSDTFDWLQLWEAQPAAAQDLCTDPMRPGSFDPSGDFSPDL